MLEVEPAKPPHTIRERDAFMLLALWNRLRRFSLTDLYALMIIIFIVWQFGSMAFYQIFGVETFIDWQPIPLYPQHVEPVVRSETPTEQSLRFTTADSIEDIVEWYDNEFNPKTRRQSDRVVEDQTPVSLRIKYQLCTGMVITLEITPTPTSKEVALVQHKYSPRDGLCSQ